MVKYLFIFLFAIIGCFKIATKDLENLNKSKISENLLSLFKGKDLDKLYEGLKDEAKNKKLIDIYSNNGLNLLMLALESNFELKDKENLFSKILLHMCIEKDIIMDFKNQDKNDLNQRNCFAPINNNLISYKELIFDKNLEFNLYEFKNILNFSKCNEREFKDILNKPNNQRRTLIFYAIDLGENIFIDFLLELVNLECPDNEGIRPLIYAICERREIVKYLHENGHLKKFDLNYNFEYKKSLSDPLIYAVMQGDKELVDILLSNGCPSNSIDENGNKAIILASNLNHEDIVSLLIARGGKYLTKEELVARKVKKHATKATTAIVQLASDIAFKAGSGGLPFSINTLSLTSSIKRSHNLDRTKLYGRILKIFLKGSWISQESYSRETLNKYKNLAGTLKYYLNKIGEEEIKKDSKLIHLKSKFKKIKENAKKAIETPIENINNLFHTFKKKLIQIKNFSERINKLVREFQEIEIKFLNLGLRIIYEELKPYFSAPKYGKDGCKFSNKLQIDLNSIKNIQSKLFNELQEILSINQNEKDTIKRIKKGKEAKPKKDKETKVKKDKEVKSKKDKEKRQKRKSQKEKNTTNQEGKENIFGKENSEERKSAKEITPYYSSFLDDEYSNNYLDLKNSNIPSINREISIDEIKYYGKQLIELLDLINKLNNRLKNLETKLNIIKNSNN